MQEFESDSAAIKASEHEAMDHLQVGMAPNAKYIEELIKMRDFADQQLQVVKEMVAEDDDPSLQEAIAQLETQKADLCDAIDNTRKAVMAKVQ